MALTTVVLLAALAVLAFVRQRVSWVAPATAPAEVFSGARAIASLRAILGGDAPHPTGTPENAAVRARLVDALRGLGLETDVRSATTCGAFGPCAVVHDVVARLPGRPHGEPRSAVLLAAHYDSVPAAPGAADDGAGIASLVEVARALAAGPPLGNDVLFLVTDGEELGLLGALAFVHRDPRAAEVSVVVNLEARGVRGPATIFETSPGDAWLVEAVAEAARPMGSSLFGFVYRMLPNDTDLSVFLARGIAGVNVAFSGGAALYHTAKDDLEHLHAGSVQHEGETALAIVRALADRDLRAPRAVDAVWFDVFGLFVVRWPASWTLPLAALGLAGAVGAAVVAVRRLRTGVRAIALGAASWLAVVLVAAALGTLVWVTARASGALPVPWIAHPAAILVALHGAPLAAILVVAALARPGRPDADGAWHGGVVVLAALAVLAANVAPKVSYVLVAPACVAGLAGLACAWLGPRARDVAIAATGVASFATWALVLGMLYPGLGLQVAPAISVATAFALAPAWPAALAIPDPHRRRAAALACGTVLAASGVSAVLPPFGPDAPRRVDVATYLERGATSARVAIVPGWFGQPWGDVPPAMHAALPGQAREAPPFPWASAAAHVADVPVPAELAALPFPEATELSRTATGSSVRIRLRLRSNRSARSLRLIAMPGSGLVDVSIPVAVAPPRAYRRGLIAGASAWIVDGVGPDGVELEVLVLEGTTGDVILADVSGDARGPAAAIAAARPSDTVPSQDGDATVLAVRLELP